MLELARLKETPYVIIISKNAPKYEIHAAEELSRFLYKISGARFPIDFDNMKLCEYEIIIGKNRHLDMLNVEVSKEKIGNEGYLLKTIEKKLIIMGGGKRGTLYGVYSFLEEYLGCRWFTEDCSSIPKRDVIKIKELDIIFKPVLESREPYYASYPEADWNVKNKCNGNSANLNELHGGKIVHDPFVHTFNMIISPDEYFDEHPEYFSLVKGFRVKENTQLCLTNPDVLELTKEKIKEWITANPDISIISVSQNDCLNFCECDECKKIDDYEQSHMGTMLRFVNSIAESIEKDYPDIAIETLAYVYTRKPPLYTRPHPNVIVRLCSIECCFSHPLNQCKNPLIVFDVAEGTKTGDFLNDLTEWGKICNRLYIWDYVANYSHPLMPHPNFKVLQPNIKFFIENNVKGIFEQGYSYTGKSGELNLLKRYILAKLLWNPDYDIEKGINEFLAGYYGLAAPMIKKYFDLLHAQINDDVHLGLDDPPTAVYLNQKFLDQAEILFEEAKKIAENEIILQRVKTAELSIRYVKLAVMPKETSGRETLLDEFFKDILSANIEVIRGHHLSKNPKKAEELLRMGKFWE